MFYNEKRLLYLNVSMSCGDVDETFFNRNVLFYCNHWKYSKSQFQKSSQISDEDFCIWGRLGCLDLYHVVSNVEMILKYLLVRNETDGGGPT